MTDYWLDFTTGGGTDDGGDGSQGNPFKSPYAARNAFALGGVFYGRGRYVRLKPASGNGRSVSVLLGGTAVNPSIVHGYDPAHPFEWWAGAMLRPTASSGPTWTDDGGGVFHAALGHSIGGGETHAGHLLWYYDLADQSVPPRQLAYAKDAVGGAHAGVDATEDSFWFDTATDTLWVHLRAGESPDGKIMIPAAEDTTNSWGDQWGQYSDNFFKNRKNIIFDGFSYLFCGTRPWDASNLSTVGHDLDGVELRRGWFGFTWKTDAVIRPVKQSRRLVIDECKLQCGGIGIVYSYSGVGSGPEICAAGHIMTGLRLTRSHLLDAGLTHRGQGDGHAIGAQASASDWICAGNLCDATTRPIVMWPRSNWYPGVMLNKIEILFNNLVNTHDSGAAKPQRMISWENTDTAASGQHYDQSGSKVSGNVIRGPVARVTANYYNGTLLDLSGDAGTVNDSPIGIRVGRTNPLNVIPAHGNQISKMSIGMSQEQLSTGTIAVDYQWNSIRQLTQHVGTSLQNFIKKNNTTAKYADEVIDRQDYRGPFQRWRGQSTNYDLLLTWQNATNGDANSTYSAS